MAFVSSDYREPDTSNYMKFQEGENTFRILGSLDGKEGCMGMEYWKTDSAGKKHPIRYNKDLPVPISELEETDENGNLKMPTFFWAIPVYNWNSKKVQILQITQKTIRQGILGLTGNKKWGDPIEYNVVVNKEKENSKTSYTVTPEPKEKISDEIIKEYKALNINWDAFMASEDPFSKDEKFERSEVAKDLEDISF